MTSPQDPNREERLSDRGAWRYVSRYLSLAFTIALAVTGALSAYNLWRQTDATQAADGLNAADATGRMTAYEALSAPHIFGGWAAPTRVVPDDAALGGLDEDALFEAAARSPNLTGEISGTLGPEACAGDADCVWRELVGGQTNMSRIELWHYLRLRYALSVGAPLEPAAQTFFAWNAGLFVAAVRAQCNGTDCTFGPGTHAPLMTLRDNLEASIHNTWVFVGFAGLVSLVFGLTWAFWQRVPWRDSEE